MFNLNTRNDENNLTTRSAGVHGGHGACRSDLTGLRLRYFSVYSGALQGAARVV